MKTHAVGTKQPNGLGIHDMSGNVWEWVADWYSAEYYGKSPLRNPQGPAQGKERVQRGGCWFNNDIYLRTTVRQKNPPELRDFDIGFRVLLPAEKVRR
jgi:formylglycine-generating enzyme required for sulfatase activity